MEYKGLYDDQEKNKEQRYFEFGAHFKYIELVKALKILQKSQNIKKEKTPNINNSNNSNIISNDQNYNEVYNQINKQLCQKMTDLMPKNKFIQSRNIKPLIQSLSQKLTDIVQSQSNKKPMKHNATKKRYLNSNVSTKQKMKNNAIIKNSEIKKANLNSIIKDIEPNYLCKNQLYKQAEISQSRNYLKNKKFSSKNNIKNVQLSHNKKNNVISHEIKNYTNLQNRTQNFGKISKISKNKNNEIIYGTILENNKVIKTNKTNNNTSNNNQNNQNTKTVQNIIVKPNINISFINNFNTTYLHKSKKRSKKIRSRNNQQLTKQNIIGNKLNLNDNNDSEYNNDCNKIIYKNIEDEDNIENNDNNIEIIFLKKNNDNTNNINIKDKENKDMNKKRTLISPKTKNKDKDIINNNVNILNNNSGSKKNNGLNYKNINLINSNNNDIIKNLIDKNQTRQININIMQESRNKNNEQNKNDNVGKNNNKINKNSLDNHSNILNNNFNNYKLINNYIQNNFNNNLNIKLNNNKQNNLNNNNQNQIFKYVNQINNKQKNSVLIRNKAVLANNISENKRAQKYFQ